MSYASIEEAVDAIGRGEFLVVVDDENRENEGDLIIAAEKVTPEKIAFMVRHTSGLICMPLTGERLDQLDLPLMVRQNTDSHHTAFTISIDYKEGTTTGISAYDRAMTIRRAVDPETRPDDFARPGHIFPLRYSPGGVLTRPGHTEAAVDLARLAGLYPAGVLCEIVNDDGSMARVPDLERFSARHGIAMITIADLIAHRWRNEALVARKVEAVIPTEFGDFKAFGYNSALDGSEHIALVRGDVTGKSDVLVRLHSECLTGDVFGSRRCDCGAQLRESLGRVAEAGQGVIVYDRGHEGRGIGLLPKLAAYRLQEEGRDTVEANLELGHPADARDYGLGAQILHDLKVTSVRLLTNNPSKVTGLRRYGVEVSATVPLVTAPTVENRRYLAAKASKLGHLIDVEELGDGT